MQCVSSRNVNDFEDERESENLFEVRMMNSQEDEQLTQGRLKSQELLLQNLVDSIPSIAAPCDLHSDKLQWNTENLAPNATLTYDKRYLKKNDLDDIPDKFSEKFDDHLDSSLNVTEQQIVQKSVKRFDKMDWDKYFGDSTFMNVDELKQLIVEIVSSVTEQMTEECEIMTRSVSAINEVMMKIAHQSAKRDRDESSRLKCQCEDKDEHIRVLSQGLELQTCKTNVIIQTILGHARKQINEQASCYTSFQENRESSFAGLENKLVNYQMLVKELNEKIHLLENEKVEFMEMHDKVVAFHEEELSLEIEEASKLECQMESVTKELMISRDFNGHLLERLSMRGDVRRRPLNWKKRQRWAKRTLLTGTTK